MKKTSAIISAVAAAVGAVVGSMAVSALFKGETGGFDKALMHTASELNKTLPLMVDRNTRLDSSVAGPGNRFAHIYTLVSLTKADVKLEAFREAMRPQLVTMYRSDPSKKSFRERDVELIYQYMDKLANFCLNW